MDEQIKKWYIYAMEYYSAMKNEEILPFATTQMDLEGIMISKVSQTEKDNTLFSNFYGESEKNELMETENRLVVARGGGNG